MRFLNPHLVVLGSVVFASALAFVNPLQQQPLGLQESQQPESVPHHLPHYPDFDFATEEKKTIYQLVSEHPKFTLLTKIIDFSETIVDVLNDTSANVTFFAPPNWALKRPRKKGKHGHKNPVQGDSEVSKFVEWHEHSDLTDVLAAIENIDTTVEDDEDKPDKEKRKAFYKKLARALLLYHILPTALDAKTLIVNHTQPTTLVLRQALDDEPQRLRVFHRALGHIVTLNLFSKLFKADVGASNGIVHAVTRPLLPPPAVFTGLFLFPGIHSIATSALQRTGLTNELDLRWVHGEDGEKGHLEGATSVTFFAPSNRAFEALPPRLQLFLFSPFGERVLKKLLQYHIVPNHIVHSDYVHNATSSSDVAWIHTPFDESSTDADMLKMYDDEFDEQSEHENMDHLMQYTSSRNRKKGFFYPPSHHGDEHHLEPRHSLPPPPMPKRPRMPEPPKMPEPPHMPAFPKPPRMPVPPSPPCGPQGFPCERGPHRRPPGPPGPPPHHPPPHHRKPFPRPEITANLTLPTLLTNHTLHLHVAKFSFAPPHGPPVVATKVFVDGQGVALPDLVSGNGAVHVVKRVLNPRGKKGKGRKERRGGSEWVNHVEEGWYSVDFEEDDGGWDDWEEWLPQWAMDN